MKKLLLFLILFIYKLTINAGIFIHIYEHDVKAVQNHIAEGKDINIQDIFGDTLLMKAVYLEEAIGCQYKEIIIIILEAGADVNIKNRFNNKTAKGIALEIGHEEIVTLLEEYEKKQESEKQATLLLFEAIKNENKDKIISLIKKGTNPSIIVKCGFNALTFAITAGYAEGVRTILETLNELGKKNLIKKMLEAKDVLKETPLELAERLSLTVFPKKPYQDIVEILQKYAKD